MNFIFQLILLTILLVSEVRTTGGTNVWGKIVKTPNLKKSPLESAEKFHSTVVKVLAEHLKCQDSETEAWRQILCHSIKNMETKFEQIKTAKKQQEHEKDAGKKAIGGRKLNTLLGELKDLILKDFMALKSLAMLTTGEIEEMGKGITGMRKGFRSQTFNENAKENKKLMEGSHHNIKELNKSLEEGKHGKQINLLMANIANLKSGHRKDAGHVEKMAVDCILELAEVIKHKKEHGGVDLETAFSVFSVELVAYSVKVDAIKEMKKKVEWPIKLN